MVIGSIFMIVQFVKLHGSVRNSANQIPDMMPNEGAAPNRHLRLGISLGVFGFHESGRGGR